MHRTQKNVEIINITKGKLFSLPFVMIKKIKDDILDKNYVLSIAYVDRKISKEINKKYRKKDNATNVLSFSLNKKEGELLLCPGIIEQEAKNLGKTFTDWLGFLVIHGMLHLKGMKHSVRMERAEKKYDKKYFGRNRHRIPINTGRSGRI